MGARGRSPAAVVAAIAVLCSAGLSHRGEAAACTSGADVRNLVESGVPQSLKDRIFKRPGDRDLQLEGHCLGKCLQFVVSELQDAALILVPSDQFLSQPLEYWVVENRNNDKPFDYEGYDADLPDQGLAIWYVSAGTYSSGHDDVRLVDFSKPDQDPDHYNNPGNDAFFKKSTGNPKRLLINRKGQWNLLYFQRVSDVAGGNSGLFMFGEF